MGVLTKNCPVVCVNQRQQRTVAVDSIFTQCFACIGNVGVNDALSCVQSPFLGILRVISVILFNPHSYLISSDPLV